MEWVMLLVYCLKVIIYWLSVSGRSWQGNIYEMCYAVLISPYLPGDYIYRNRPECDKWSREWFVWECTRLFMLIGFIPNTLQEILCSMNSFICCFSTSFCIHFQSFRGFLICGASLLAGLCVVRDFAGGIFKKTCLKITNNLISNA